MATVIESGSEMSVGRIFARGFGVIADNPVTVIGIAFVLGALPSVLINMGEQPLLASKMDQVQIVGSLGVIFASMLAGLVLQALVQGSLVRATLAFARGERATFGECVGASLAVALPLVGLAILMALAVWFGMMLFFVPGVMLYVMWSVASPALVAERTGVFGAFGRSRFLTKGARWKVFGIQVILLIGCYGIFAAVLGAAFTTIGINAAAPVATAFSIGWILSTAITATVVNTVWSTVQTALYVELRNWKEGLPDKSLEEIFA
jgi:hypothetical protein